MAASGVEYNLPKIRLFLLLNEADEAGDEGTVAKLLLVLVGVVSEALALALPTVDANELAVELLGTLHASWLLLLVVEVLVRDDGGGTRRVGVVVVAFVLFDAVGFKTSK